MSESHDRSQPTTRTTELILATGDHHWVQGDTKDVERTILDAARGSIMQLAWLTDAASGDQLGVNPDQVVLLRAAAPRSDS